MASAARLSSKALIVVLFAAYQLLAHFVLRDSLGAAAASGLMHAGAFLFMLWFFGRTLRAGSQPLVTRLALSVHGSLSPEMVLYTRRVTQAWCLFFAAQLVLSPLLLALAPFEAWSLFVNVLTLPTVALMFAGDYLYRALHFPHHPRVPLSRVARAFVEVTSESVGRRTQ